MPTLADDFRKRAEQLRATANEVAEQPTYITSPKKQLIAIVGHVHANNLEDLAEVIDYLRGSQQLNEFRKKKTALANRTHDMRMAAAKGDWDGFTRLAEKYTSEEHPPESGAERTGEASRSAEAGANGGSSIPEEESAVGG